MDIFALSGTINLFLRISTHEKTLAHVKGVRSSRADSFQNIPQYVEVPPNIEAKQIISYLSAVLSYSSNHMLLKDETKLLIFLRLLAGHLLLHFYDPCNHTDEGPF